MLFIATAVAVVTLVTSATAQQSRVAPPPAMPDVQRLGPQVGSTVPNFSLSDQNGRTRTLRSLMGPKGLMLVFSRSADWCPYCKTQLVEIQGGSRNCVGAV
jgi:cytochrome oxidase Cu insertion factor (SCO1/SenC/PrrC family)